MDLWMRYLTNVITFDDEMIGSVNKRTVDFAFLDFSNAFDTAILIDKLLKYRLDKWTLRWTENWLKWDMDHKVRKLVISYAQLYYTILTKCQ